MILAARMALVASALALAGACSRNPFIPPRYEQAEVRDIALESYDEGVLFADAGNSEIALERLNRAVAVSPRPAVYFKKAQLHQAAGDKADAALAYVKALEGAPDYQEARFALLDLGFNPPSESEMTTGSQEAYRKFSEEVELEAGVWRAEAEQEAKKLTPEEREALRTQVRARMTEASEKRMPTLAEVRAAIFPAGGEADEEAMPSATSPVFSSERDIILNTYAYHFANGQRLQKGREYEKAASEYRTALAIDPDQIEARLNLGDCMLRLERYPQALHHYLTANEQFPESAKPLFKLGNYYESVNRTVLARTYYEQSVARDSEYIEALNNLGALEIREKNYNKAIEYFVKVLQINPDYALAYLNLGVAQENSGDKTAALKSYQRYVEMGGERSEEVSSWISEMK